MFKTCHFAAICNLLVFTVKLVYDGVRVGEGSGINVMSHFFTGFFKIDL